MTRPSAASMGTLISALVWELDGVAQRHGAPRFYATSDVRQQQAQATLVAVADWLDANFDASSFTLGNDAITARNITALLRDAARHTMSGSVSQRAGQSPPAKPKRDIKEK
jgi:hypothetical protein